MEFGSLSIGYLAANNFLKMKKYKIIFSTLFGLAFYVFFAVSVSASATNGSITPSSDCSTSNCAWSTNGGWINFAPTNSNGGYQGTTVIDTAVTGHAWSQNFGWINFGSFNEGGGVANNYAGVLTGSAWGENTGWIDFSGVKINSEGRFTGATVSNSIIGQINFDCSSCIVQTDWRAGSEPFLGGGSTYTPNLNLNNNNENQPSSGQQPIVDYINQVMDQISKFLPTPGTTSLNLQPPGSPTSVQPTQPPSGTQSAPIVEIIQKIVKAIGDLFNFVFTK